MTMPISAPPLKTARLTLRDLLPEDAVDIVAWRSSPQVYCFFKHPHQLSLEEHLNWYSSRYIYDQNRYDYMGIDNQGERVGVFGIRRHQEGDPAAEISYLLAPGFCGKGFASEAVLELMAFCRNEWKSKFVLAEIHRDNLDSLRFVQRLGFTEQQQVDCFLIYQKEL